MYVPYEDEAMEYLKKKDKKLAAAIDEIGPIRREMHVGLFDSLCHSIIDQQISTAAGASIYRRVVALCEGALTPAALLAQGEEALRACGLSGRKVVYLQALARAVDSGELDIEGLRTLSDEDVVKALTALPGIGVWTAEMFLIFSLGRPDVVSYGDLAIRRGMMRLYGLKELPKEKFARYRRRYTPHGTLASLYLWELSK